MLSMDISVYDCLQCVWIGLGADVVYGCLCI